MKLNIKKIVEDIHAVEREIREHNKLFRYENYKLIEKATALYTLRASNRNKNHRVNPPEEIRCFNRSMRETGRENRCIIWDMEKHNQKVIEKISDEYVILENEIQSEAVA
jgi:hypothetical protein